MAWKLLQNVSAQTQHILLLSVRFSFEGNLTASRKKIFKINKVILNSTSFRKVGVYKDNFFMFKHANLYNQWMYGKKKEKEAKISTGK